MKTHVLALVLAAAFVAAPAHAAPVNVQSFLGGVKYRKMRLTGPSSLRYDVVIVGDGFTGSEQSVFQQRATDVMNGILAREPYAARKDAFNFWRVHVLSKESGADHPKTGVTKNTELNCSYSNTTDERELGCDSARVNEAAGYAPDADMVVVIVNDATYGGLAWANVFTVSLDASLQSIATHELGHKLGLGDEYECRACDGTDSGRTHPGPEPAAPNLTRAGTREKLKWTDLVAQATPIPTTTDNPMGVVGAWEGGDYYAKGVYRPQRDCHMRALGAGFCQVCARAIGNELGKHLTACENPDLEIFRAHACARDFARIIPLIRKIDVWWDPTHRIRWPIPLPCNGCGPMRRFGPEPYEVRLAGLPRGTTVGVYDATGAEVSRGMAAGDEVVLSFTGQPRQSLYIEAWVDPATLERGGSRSVVQARLTRAGVEQPLP